MFLLASLISHTPSTRKPPVFTQSIYSYTMLPFLPRGLHLDLCSHVIGLRIPACLRVCFALCAVVCIAVRPHILLFCFTSVLLHPKTWLTYYTSDLSDILHNFKYVLLDIVQQSVWNKFLCVLAKYRRCPLNHSGARREQRRRHSIIRTTVSVSLVP